VNRLVALLGHVADAAPDVPGVRELLKRIVAQAAQL